MANTTSTVASTGGDYSSLNAAFDDFFGVTSGDFVTAQDQHTCTCNNFEDTAMCSVPTGWTTSTTYYPHVVAADNHGGVYSTSAYRLDVANWAGVDLWNAVIDCKFTGIQVYVTYSTSAYAVRSPASGGSCTWFRCIAMLLATGAGSYSVMSAKGPADFHACILAGFNYTSAGVSTLNQVADGNTILRNCTIYIDAATGYLLNCNSTTNTAQFVNCHTSGYGSFSSGVNYVYSGSDYNLSDNTGTVPTNWGTNSTNSNTVAFNDNTWTTTPWEEIDLRRTTSDDGYNAGTSQSSYFTVDVQNNTWVTWDIGADDVEAATATQEGFQFYDDDAAEGSATTLASQDGNITRAKTTNTRLRILTDYSGDPATQQAALQYRKVGDPDSEWRDVPTS